MYTFYIKFSYLPTIDHVLLKIVCNNKMFAISKNWN